MFYVGQKVVCVDDSPTPLGVPVPFTRGEAVTVSGFSGPACVFLSEHPGHFPAAGYYSHRFRPLTDQKKSVSFTQGAPRDSERWDNRRKVVEPFPVDGWGA